MAKKEIFLLTDYKGRFGSKHDDSPYRSGMDKNRLELLFKTHGYEARFLGFRDVDFRTNQYTGKPVVYTSSEDRHADYKSYIEDTALGLKLAGARLIPSYEYLRAHNNKVFMEILRDLSFDEKYKNIKSARFGTFEELDTSKLPESPWVIKSWSGANSRRVGLAEKLGDLKRLAKKYSRTPDLYRAIYEIGRTIKHKGYIRDSFHRNKFIVQNFIPGLKNDWKIYVFGDRYYIFYRPVLKKNRFKASGGGYDNYAYGSHAMAPEGILKFAGRIYDLLGVPHCSLDIAWDGETFYLIEFQVLYFGTAGILYSDCYYRRRDSLWEPVFEKEDIETVWVESIVKFLGK